MTGIALGLAEIENIALGSTPIVKVSLGDELVWPQTPSDPVYFGRRGILLGFTQSTMQVVVPAGANRVGFCLVGTGGGGNTSGEGAGGGGGGLVWMNFNVTPGETLEVLTFAGAQSIQAHLNGSINPFATVSAPGLAGSNTGGAGGTVTVAAGELVGRNLTFGRSTGGAGGNTNTSGRSGGGGSAGGYVEGVAGVTGAAGFANTPGTAGVNGSGGSGGANVNVAGIGGSTFVFGQGTNGAAGASSGGAGGRGSPSVNFPTYYGGGGSQGRANNQELPAFAVRFFAADYPTFVEPVTLTEVPVT